GRRIGKPDQEDVVRLQHPHAREALLHLRTFGGRGGIEVRVEPGLRATVESTYRDRTGHRRRRVENLEAQARALPAGELSTVERCDLACVGGDEIVVELRI